MNGSTLDDLDRAILYALQGDARNQSNAAISETLGISASTVGKRIAALEDADVITGYHPEIDFERAGFPLCVLFVCSAPIAERRALIEQALAIAGVVNVVELMTGERNVQIQAVGMSTEDISRVASKLDTLGFTVHDEILISGEYTRPLSHFRQADLDP